MAAYLPFSKEGSTVESPVRAAKSSPSNSCHAKRGKHLILRALLRRQHHCLTGTVSLLVQLTQAPLFSSARQGTPRPPIKSPGTGGFEVKVQRAAVGVLYCLTAETRL